MTPTGAVAREKDVGRIVALAEHVVVRGDDVLERPGKDVLGDRGETVARRDEHPLASAPRVGGDAAEQLGVELGVRGVRGVK